MNGCIFLPIISFFYSILVRIDIPEFKAYECYLFRIFSKIKMHAAFYFVVDQILQERISNIK